MPKNKANLFEDFFHRLLPFDHLVLIYCWIIIILTVNFANSIDDYLGVLAFHFGMIVLVVLLVQFARSETNRFVVLIRLLYPVFALTFLYQNCGKLIHLIAAGYFDYRVVALEKSIIGANITLWLDARSSVFLTELMSAGYFSYYFMIAGLAFILFFSHRDREIKRFMTATCATFFISYLIFIFYPVAGPRFHLASAYQNELTGPFFRQLVNMVINGAAFRGGAMPSSHVAEAVVVMYFAIRFYGKKAWLMVPIVICLALGTVYGRFHYVTDVVMGIILGAITTWLTVKFYPMDKESTRDIKLTDSDMVKRYASHNI